MINSYLQCKLEFFRPISQKEQQCLVCLKKVCMKQTEEQIDEQLNKHFTSENHVLSQYRILFEMGFFQRLQQEQSTVNEQFFFRGKMFNINTAKELKSSDKEKLNKYFEKGEQKIIDHLKGLSHHPKKILQLHFGLRIRQSTRRQYLKVFRD